MTDLTKILESFNRKERYFLLCNALGLEKFLLSEQFRKRIEEAIGVEVPEGAFVAMDYHMDWLAAGLALYTSEKSSHFCNPIGPGNRRLVEGNQEDADLLVAFQCSSDKKYHIVMIEAKGYTGWLSEQLESKSQRLMHIFGDGEGKYDNVVPHFLMLSESKPDNLPSVETWPCWMRCGSEGEPAHLKLQLADSSRRKVERWNPDKKKPDKSGSHFRVR